jgi:hypothetical protein
MSSLICISDGSALWPANDQAAAAILKVAFRGQKERPDRTCLVALDRPRNMRQMRLAFHLLHLVFDAGVWDRGNFDNFRDAVSIEVGACDIAYKLDGTPYVRPHSWAVIGGMKTDEFEEMFHRMVDLICDKLLAGFSREKLREQVIALVDQQYAASQLARPVPRRHGPPPSLFSDL